MADKKPFLCYYITAFALIAFFNLPTAAQTIWYVDDDAPNDPGPGTPTVSDPDEDGSAEHPFDAIQEGIDAATDGHEVVVLEGTYTGDGNRDLDFGGKAITVRSENGPEVTIIDCQDGGRGFYFHSGEGADSVVEGFKITNGNGVYDGGGIYCNDSSPTIMNNTITGNNAHYGGGVCCGFSSSSPMIANNIITGNSAEVGGGIFCYYYSYPIIANNMITENYAEHDGGGISCSRSSPTIANNTITGNSAYFDGGGICCNGSSLTIANNTITANVALDGHAFACVSYNHNPSTLTIANSIVWNSTNWMWNNDDSIIMITYSDIQGGWPGEGNIDDDPMFVDPDGKDDDPYTWKDNDFHLSSGSPCIDAGDSASVPAGITSDLDGNNRIVNCIVDMGAYEADYGLPSPIPGDFNADCDVDGADHDTFESCASGPSIPHSGSETCQQADFDEDNDVDQDDFAAFQRCYSGENNPADPNCAD